MDVVRGRIGPATNVRTLNLRLNFLMSFSYQYFYTSKVVGHLNPGNVKSILLLVVAALVLVPFMKDFFLDKFTGSKSIWSRLLQLFRHLMLMNVFLQPRSAAAMY